MSLRKKPWNRIDLPVYSISSTDGDGQHNMNIISYVTAVSMKPKRFVCCIYKGTKTLELVTQHKEFVLQLLQANQYNLVTLLGKQSGKKIDKISRLQKRKMLTEWKGFYILNNALAVVQLKSTGSFDGGDHIGFICDVMSYQNLQEGQPLTLDILRKRKLIIA